MFTAPVIIGNLCTLLAMGANAASATRKSKKSMLQVQNISQVIYCLGSIVLRGYSAAVQNVVSIARNIVAIRNIKSKSLEWTLVVLGAVLGVAFNNRGVLGLLPVIGTLQYTLAIFRIKGNERALKISFLLSTVAFVAFNISLYNFAGAAADSTVAITTIVALIRENNKKLAQ